MPARWHRTRALGWSPLGGNTPLVSSVYIAYETHADFQALNGPIGFPIAEILTGLSVERLERQGILFRDPVNPDQLLDSTPSVA